MGPYCRYCDRRCFVLRITWDGRTVCLATCPEGMAHDRRVCGQDHRTALNPVTRRRDITPDARNLPMLTPDGVGTLQSLILVGMFQWLAERKLVSAPEQDGLFYPEVYLIASRQAHVGYPARTAVTGDAE